MRDVTPLRGGLHPVFFSQHPWVGVLLLLVIIGVVVYRNQRNH